LACNTLVIITVVQNAEEKASVSAFRRLRLFNQVTSNLTL